MNEISLHIKDVSYCSDDIPVIELSDFLFQGSPCNLPDNITMYTVEGFTAKIYFLDVEKLIILMIVHQTQKKSSLKTSITDFIFPVDPSCTFTSQELQAVGEFIIAVPNADCKSQKSNIVKTTKKYENFDSQSLKDLFNGIRDHGEKDSRICSGWFSI